MAYEVVLDPLVVDKVDEIVGYISEVLASPNAATSFLDAFEELVGNLEELPLAYPFAQDPRIAARGYRRALVGNYLVLFRVDETGERSGVVLVTNVFHGSQNYRELL